MKIAAITAEFNPLHNGHLRLLRAVKEELSPDLLLVLLGGDVTQRGELALFDKYTRAKHAVNAGAEVVLELPQIFAASCAERFADAAVKTLSFVDAEEKYICFGSECGDLTAIRNAAKILNDEPEELSEELRSLLEMGCSYPAARAQAFLHYAEARKLSVADPTLPNNILAIEYLRAALKRGGVLPYTLKRNGAYQASSVDPQAPSASALRRAFFEGAPTDAYRAALPEYVEKDLALASKVDHFSPLLLYRLSTITPEGFKRINDVSEGIENRILRLAKESKNVASLVKAVSTKRYTEARVSRILVSALLGVTKLAFESEIDAPPYYKVLAVKKEKTDILSLLSRAGQVITGETEAKESGRFSAMIDAKAHEIYSIAKEAPDLESGMLVL